MTTHRTLLLCALCSVYLALLPITAVAQAPAQSTDQAPVTLPAEAERRQVVPFLDGTYVFLTAPRDHIRFEADIQPNFVITQNFSDRLVTDESLDGRPRWAYSVVGTPRVRLRMLDSRSAPVRTPSYMPKGTVTGLLFRGERTNDNGAGARVGLWAGQLTIGHHSNGQDGCLFTTDTPPTDTTDCTGPPDLTKINTTDGSFSTNYARFGMRYRREWLKDVSTDEQKKAGIEDQVGTHEITFGVDYDRHFHTDPRMKPFYGLNRVAGSIAYADHLRRVCRSRISVSETLFYVGEQPPDVPSVATQTDAKCTFTDQGGWGIFVRYYYGQDYYNLGFTTTINRVMFGAHFEQDGFLRFVSRKAKTAEEDAKRRREAR